MASLYANAVTFSFESHVGPVYGLEFNPHHRHIFSTCSVDGTLRIYHSLRAKPIVVLEPIVAAAASAGGKGGGGVTAVSTILYSVCWSPVRPLVLAVSTSAGEIFIYDFTETTMGPVLTLNGNVDRVGIVSLSWNKIDPGLLASVDLKGRAVVWQLSERFTDVQRGEFKMIEQMGQLAADS